MISSLFFIVPLFHSVAFGAAVPICKSKIVCVRGSKEDPGCGLQLGSVADKIKERLGDAEVVPLDYPAQINLDDIKIYTDSVRKGVEALDNLMKSFDEKSKCATYPNVTLLGYSQGANVIGDWFAGGISNETEGGFAKELGKSESFKGATFFGDPRRFGNETGEWQKGTAIADGKEDHGSFFGRTEHQEKVLAALGNANKLESFCDELDRYCASGPKGASIKWEEPAHHQYNKEYSDVVVEWAVGNFGR